MMHRWQQTMWGRRKGKRNRNSIFFMTDLARSELTYTTLLPQAFSTIQKQVLHTYLSYLLTISFSDTPVLTRQQRKG